MTALQTPEVNKGWQAVDFKLIGIDNKYYSISDLAKPKGLLIMFICNHCPFVKSIIDKVVTDVIRMQDLGFGVVAISANDVQSYPEDSFPNMQKFASSHKFNFPYLYDETQEVAKKYDAVCTPDFFAFNSKLELQYRGRFDASGRNLNIETKHELFEAVHEIASTGEYKGEQLPSIGCSIKWK